MNAPVNIIIAILGVALIALFAQCTTDPDPQRSLQTEILEVKVEPNPVPTGDTATITCVIADSLDKSFRFEWNFDQTAVQDTTTESRSVTWRAPAESGTYNHSVIASNGSADAFPATRLFTIRVVGQGN